MNDCFSEYIGIIDKSLPIDRKLKNFLTIEDLMSVNMNQSESSSTSSPSPSSPKKLDHTFSLSSLINPESDGDYC